MVSHSIQFYILSVAVIYFSSSAVGQNWSEESNLSANRTELQNSTYINGVCNEDVGICVCSGNCPQFVVDNWSQYGSGCNVHSLMAIQIAVI